MRQAAGRAFTLIELLVVIGIIAVLVGIFLTVAPRLIDSGRSQATESTLLRIETVIGDLSADTDLRPKDYRTYEAVDGSRTALLPLIDARIDGAGVDKSDRAEPSLGRFLKIAEETVPGIASRWQQLDPSSLREGQIGGSLIGSGLPVDVIGTEVLDSWGNPIRFVHPSFDGGAGEWFDSDGGRQGRDLLEVDVDGDDSPDAQFRRSFRPFDPTDPMLPDDPIGDADEGICPGGRPYVYSAGPDGDPGTRADNVYGSVVPEFPDETAGQD